MAFLSGWNTENRIEFRIDHTKVDSDLTHYPVMLKLEQARVFTELGSNSKKIAVTKDDGTTQLYVDIELWDNTNDLAVLHVSKSDWTVSSTEDTVLYFYYDSTQSDNTTYVGDTGDTV